MASWANLESEARDVAEAGRKCLIGEDGVAIFNRSGVMDILGKCRSA